MGIKLLEQLPQELLIQKKNSISSLNLFYIKMENNIMQEQKSLEINKKLLQLLLKLKVESNSTEKKFIECYRVHIKSQNNLFNNISEIS